MCHGSWLQNLQYQRKTGHKEEAEADEETTEEEQEAPVSLLTHENNILHSMFSNIEVYINNQQIYNYNRLYAHKSLISNNFKGAIPKNEGVLHSGGYDYEEFPDEIMEAPLSEHFFTRRMKMLSRPNGFMLYGQLRVDLFSTLALLYPILKVRLRLIRARPKFYMISDNLNISHGIVDCSLYTRRNALTYDYHQKRMDMLAYTPVELNSLETLAKTFILPARQNQFIENIFNNAPVRRVAFAMNTNAAFTGLYTENPFWCQQFDLRQIRILRSGQPIVYFDAAYNRRLYVTTRKAKNFQGVIPPISIDNFKDNYVLLLDLTSMQDDTEHCEYPELVGELLRLELTSTFPQEHVTENIVLRKRMSSVADDKFGVVGKTSKKDDISLQQTNNRIPLLKNRHLNLIPSDYVPILPNESFAIINTEISNMEGQHWIMIANSRHKLYFADSVDLVSSSSSISR